MTHLVSQEAVYPKKGPGSPPQLLPSSFASLPPMSKPLLLPQGSLVPMLRVWYLSEYLTEFLLLRRLRGGRPGSQSGTCPPSLQDRLGSRVPLLPRLQLRLPGECAECAFGAEPS